MVCREMREIMAFPDKGLIANDAQVFDRGVERVERTITGINKPKE